MYIFFITAQQVAGTIFNDLDDESVLAAVDMSHFEELFKTRAQDSEADRERMEKLMRIQARRGTTLIDTNRARNLAITLRKIGLDTESICKAVYSYDLQALQLEYVEMLPNFIPNDTEMKAIKVMFCFQLLKITMLYLLVFIKCIPSWHNLGIELKLDIYNSCLKINMGY